MEIKVVHCKTEPYDIYIGRSKTDNKWGNPFSHKDDTLAQFKVNNRKEAIESFRKWITEGDGQYLLDDLYELDGKVLGCWCKPNKACHGDVLKELREKQKQIKLF